jgi:DNA-binding transcriptional MerR regulator
MAYTVKEISDLAGVSARTLHYYDEIGLLHPAEVGENGYRYYDDDDLLRLQQILFFREMDLSLKQIRQIIDAPEFDVLDALETHREALQDRIQRLNALIDTVDSTIMHLVGEVNMSKKKLFAGFTAEEEKRYEQEAREAYGDEEVSASYKLWNSYSAQKKDDIKAEGNAIYTDLAALLDAEADPVSPDVQAVIARWHQHMRYFYEPSVERLRGLGQLYVESPDFARNFREVHPELPEYMREAITVYCDNLA